MHEDDIGGAAVSAGGLISLASRSFSGQTTKSAFMEVPSSSAPSTSLPQVPRDAPTSRMETLQCLFRVRGFSRKAARFMSQPVRQSSSSVYQAKWRVYCDWCKSRGLDPCSASIVELADFFVFLRDTKLLSVSAIRGYRSVSVGHRSYNR